MRIIKLDRKAELTTQQIVTIIILIVSFGVILFFLFRLNLGSTSDSEICHNSVVLKGKSTLAGSLDCKTDYICITSDGTCEKMTKPKIEEVKSDKDVYKILADNMADCWWMFGEGKIDYVGDDITPNLYCSICSQIAFDNSLKSDVFRSGEINKAALFDFMSENNVSGKKISYSNYLSDFGSNQYVKSNYDVGTINLDSQYYLFTGIFSGVSASKWVGGGAATGALTLAVLTASTGIGLPVSAVIILGGAGGGAGGYLGSVIQGPSGSEYIPPLVIEANSDDFKSFDCEEINTLA